MSKTRFISGAAVAAAGLAGAYYVNQQHQNSSKIATTVSIAKKANVAKVTATISTNQTQHKMIAVKSLENTSKKFESTLDLKHLSKPLHKAPVQLKIFHKNKVEFYYEVGKAYTEKQSFEFAKISFEKMLLSKPKKREHSEFFKFAGEVFEETSKNDREDERAGLYFRVANLLEENKIDEVEDLINPINHLYFKTQSMAK